MVVLLRRLPPFLRTYNRTSTTVLLPLALCSTFPQNAPIISASESLAQPSESSVLSSDDLFNPKDLSLLLFRQSTWASVSVTILVFGGSSRRPLRSVNCLPNLHSSPNCS